MRLLIVVVVLYILYSISLRKVFKKAGLDEQRAIIPFKNMGDLAEIVGQKRSHAWWLLFPIVNIFIASGLAIDLVRSFGKYSFLDSCKAVVLGPINNFLLGNDSSKYIGPAYAKEREYKMKIEQAKKDNNTLELQKLERNNPFSRGPLREWSEAIIFAVFAASFIRMFLLEAFMIPTGSMESSLMTGDFLFVSKVHYGVRMPQTIAMLPLVHNRTPIVGGESYLKNPKLPYKRLPAITEVERNDAVVFNYPEGDSIYFFPNRTWSKYDLERGNVPENAAQFIRNGNVKLVSRPMDKADHYIKRCVGVPGDKLEIKNRQLYINDRIADDPENIQFSYQVKFNGPVNTKRLIDLGIKVSERAKVNNIYLLNLTEKQKQKLESMGDVIMEPIENRRMGSRLFPHDAKRYNWSLDDYGPINIPGRGITLDLNMDNIPFYSRLISVYEDNDLVVKNGKIFINGEEKTSYTCKWNYYWMMGDNRHNSEDSRFWGFVPETHVVGKPLFIWMSLKNGTIKDGIQWDRIFTSANKN